MNVAVRPLNYISLCTGGGGLDLALELACPPARPVLYVEREAYACGRLVEAMEEGRLAEAPVWSDATTLRGRPWRSLVDGLIGGIPCQPHSLAGKRGGAEDERDLWSDTRRIIAQARPWFVLIENVPGMLSAKPGQVPGAERVRRDLHRMGFQVEGGLFSAEGVGFSHERERVFILATWGVGQADAPEPGPQRREPGRDDRLGERAASERGGGDLDPGRGLLADAGRDGRERRAERDLWAQQSGQQTPLGRNPERRHPEVAHAAGQGGGQPRVRPESTGPGRPARRVEPAGLGGRCEPMAHALGGDLGGRSVEPQRGSEGRGTSGRSGQDRRVRSEGEVLEGLHRSEHLADGDGDEPTAIRRDPGEVPDLPGGQGGADDSAALPGRGGDFPISPPGPGDIDAWRAVLAERPELAPALPQSALRRMADELGRPRIDELRLGGNGVVPLAGAYAIRALATRLAARGSAGATLLVRVMGEQP